MMVLFKIKVYILIFMGRYFKFKSSLVNMFGENFLKCSILKHKKGDRIYILGESMDVIRHNINKFMHKNMLYKINSELK
jgi:hypothetical protein